MSGSSLPATATATATAACCPVCAPPSAGLGSPAAGRLPRGMAARLPRLPCGWRSSPLLPTLGELSWRRCPPRLAASVARLCRPRRVGVDPGVGSVGPRGPVRPRQGRTRPDGCPGAAGRRALEPADPCRDLPAPSRRSAQLSSRVATRSHHAAVPHVAAAVADQHQGQHVHLLHRQAAQAVQAHLLLGAAQLAGDRHRC